jgi:hypothetical protein
MFRFFPILLAAALAVALGPSAHAQEATGHDAPAKAQARAVPRPGDRDCLRSTGSLIPPKPGQCLPVAGRSYDQDDIRRTGARTTAEALRLLDPSVTVRGH